MGANRDRFDAAASHTPQKAKDWGEGISDDVDLSVLSEDVRSVVRLTQSAYDALDPADPDTLYVVVD